MSYTPEKGPSLAAVVLTKDEALNIQQSLESLERVPRVYVVDSGSTDGTQDIARAYDNVEVIERAWPGYAAQKNWAIREIGRDYEWLLFLDADEYLPIQTSQAILHMCKTLDESVKGVAFKRLLVFLGSNLGEVGPRGGFIRLVRPGAAHFEDRLVNEHLIVSGQIRRSPEPIAHHDRRSMDHWVHKQVDYSRLEAVTKQTRPRSAAGFRRWLIDRIWPRLPFRTILRFLYHFLFRGLFRAGRAGYYYSAQQSVNELHMSMFAYAQEEDGDAATDGPTLEGGPGR